MEYLRLRSPVHFGLPSKRVVKTNEIGAVEAIATLMNRLVGSRMADHLIEISWTKKLEAGQWSQ
jgi:hypothetical protein